MDDRDVAVVLATLARIEALLKELLALQKQVALGMGIRPND